MDMDVRYFPHRALKMAQLCEKSRNKTAQLGGFTRLLEVHS
jgi:methyl coenzyme M reductase subunit D